MRSKPLGLGLVVALLGIAASALGQANLSRIEYRKASDGIEVAIHGDSLTNPKVLRVMAGTSYIIEFAGELKGKPAKITVGRHGVKWVQAIQYSRKPAKVRVHFKVTASASPRLTQEDGIWTVRFGNFDPAAAPAPVNKINIAKPTSKEDLAAMTSAQMLLESSSAVATMPAAKPTNPIIAAAMNGKSAEPKQNATANSQLDAYKFPETVPPLFAPAPKPLVAPVRAELEQRVSLDFVGTDVVQILKALSIQAGVNIIASPEVSPIGAPVKLTLSLHKVTLDDSLSFITAMAGLRYARVGETFVVTPSGNFSTAMRQILERSGDRYETRVVNLTSGEATQIRDATLKALPQDGRNGFYEVLVPGGDLGAQPNAQTGQPGGETGAAPTAGAGGQVPQTTVNSALASQNAPTRVRAFYLLLVGEKQRLDAVERYVKDIDSRIAQSFSLSRAEDTGTVVVPVVSGETERIKAMLERLLSDNPRASEYSISESAMKDLPEAEESTKVLLMIGPKAELKTLETFARALDEDLCKAVGISYSLDAADRERVYEVVELKYLEPLVAEFDLKSRVRGLHVTVLPDPVTPGIKGEDEGEKQAAPTDQQAGGKTEAPKDELKRAIGKEPMKLVLRGTRDQIRQAREYLAKVDVAPQQVALELRVMELTKEEASRVGIDWSLLTGGRLTSFRMNQGLGDNLANAGTFGGNYTYRRNDQFSALATLDSISTDRNLIARPNALVTDGRATNIFVGDTVRYIKSIQSTQNGTTIETDEVEVGVLVNVLARVGADGNIALDLNQNFSVLNGFTPVPGGGNLPQTSDRTTNMFVNLKSGETLALGGLILEQDRKVLGGIPILKDLPIIGKFFSRTTTNKNRTEIVFFLTAYVVDDETRGNAASPRTSTGRTPDPMKDYKSGN